MRPRLRLAHLHLPGLTPFSHASALQEGLVSSLLHARQQATASCNENKPNPNTSARNDSFIGRSVRNPVLLTFTPNPVYTTGRRDRPDHRSASSSPITSYIDHDLPEPLRPIRHLLTSTPPVAEYRPTLRGGQTTYHGPGQLVAYLIMDLRWMQLGVRDHVHLLEDTMIDMLGQYGVKGTSSQDPGVWVEQAPGRHHPSNSAGVSTSINKSGADTETQALPLRKIAALGVHCRKFVASHGIALNVTKEPMWYFQQIVPCGLEGKEATCLEGEGAQGVLAIDDAADRFAQAFVQRFNEDFGSSTRTNAQEIKGVYKLAEGDVLRCMDKEGAVECGPRG